MLRARQVDETHRIVALDIAVGQPFGVAQVKCGCSSHATRSRARERASQLPLAAVASRF